MEKNEKLKECKKDLSIKNNRIVYFDMLNIIAILAVVAMHCNGIVHGNPNVRAWNTSLIVDCIFYWAVPIFLMLSGATLMKYRERYDTKNFFKKRFLKVFIPLCFWSIIMLFWKIQIKQINYHEILNVNNFINIILNNKEESTYYFMFDILGIYLTMPLLSLLAKEEYKKTLWFTVLLYFIFNATLANILPIIGITYNNSLTVQVGGYVVYVILGYLLSNQDLTRKQKIFLYIGAITGLIYRYVTTFILSKESGQVIKTTWGYCSWHCIFLACSVFVCVKELKINEKIKNNSKIVKILSEISSCSFGIYLIHLVIKYYELNLFNWSIYSWYFRTFGVLSTYLISLSIVYILKRIPIVKKIVP